jgi:predicted permease
MLRLFAENLLPVFLAAGAGYLLAARMKIDPRPLTHVAFFVLAPCLVFQVIVHSELGADALIRMVGFAAAVLLGAAALAALAAWRLGWSRPLVAAIVLVVMLPNAGNFGLSVNLFAFGDAGLAQASIFFVTSATLTFTVGVFVASLGRTTLRQALAGLPRVPTIWAVLLALVMSRLEWTLPFPLERAVDLLSQACIPIFLVILGMQLQGRGVRAPAAPLLLSIAMRLVGGAAIGLLLARSFGLEDAARAAGILQASMPAAVICIILASEYDTEPSFVTSVVFFTTLLSPLTLTPLMAFLGA